ncbi:hypothetical protein OIU77_019166 [Salix suchowensis]|uniref:Uncharacterized protein n=1 Tax=Salix suchowensis TaxID=1278906 RepID=A0ABQ9CI63_9ROSI|nr:hypothetical protein OIU77_019166 [Salix suchowensis]
MGEGLFLSVVIVLSLFHAVIIKGSSATVLIKPSSSFPDLPAKFALSLNGSRIRLRMPRVLAFRAAIVFDDKDNRNLIYMMVNPEGIKVHAVFVSRSPHHCFCYSQTLAALAANK